MFAQILKRTGKRTWRPDRAVRAAGDVTAGVVSTAGLKMLFLRLVPLRMLAGLPLSVDTVTVLPLTRCCSVIWIVSFYIKVFGIFTPLWQSEWRFGTSELQGAPSNHRIAESW
jgi:hypothetical protein